MDNQTDRSQTESDLRITLDENGAMIIPDTATPIPDKTVMKKKPETLFDF